MKGLEAQKANILAAKSVARIMRSSLGPKGMDKILQSPDGDVTISASIGLHNYCAVKNNASVFCCASRKYPLDCGLIIQSASRNCL